ncbi:unnamed protein product, partial [Mesorhabditis belari]|uniref:Uncharacterized protein n=1 Tax=Mesorhabditis belari TaxID=2138241 RepID=A0AAF3EUR9_9BILA
MILFSLIIVFNFIDFLLANTLADQLCKSNSESLFCQRRSSRRLDTVRSKQKVRVYGVQLSKIDEEYLRIARETHDDPSCPIHKEEYDNVCFTIPPVQVLIETKAFCDAFVEMCNDMLKTNLFTRIKGFRIDFTKYCKRYKARFQFVCPDPLRFHSYAEDAVDFCIRYQERCPEVEVPSAPILFKEKHDHIYVREIKQFCDKLANFAANYCTNPDILKVPKYQFPCGLYKYQCVDIYKEVIYGWGKK